MNGGERTAGRSAGVPAWSLVIACALIAAGCTSPASFLKPAEKPPTATATAPAAAPAPAPAPTPAPPTQQELDQAAQRELDEGIAMYDKGDYNAAIERMTNSPAIAEGSVAIRVIAHKYAAFSYCVTKRTTQCRAQFEAAYKLDPAFDLTPAERGHPLWGPVFDRVKRAQQAPAKK